MVSLVLVFCLVADPHQCMERRPLMAAELTPTACIMQGEIVAARMESQELALASGEYRFTSWRCEVGRPPGRQT